MQKLLTVVIPAYNEGNAIKGTIKEIKSVMKKNKIDKNSEIIVRYMFAAEQLRTGLAVEILDHIFTEKNSEGIWLKRRFH